MPLRQFQVVGRKVPTEQEPNPEIFRMKVFAPNDVTAKSRFWYFLHVLHKLKKATGEILSVNEIYERKLGTVKNYAVWLRYNSRSGSHNMYKEVRDVSLTHAVQAVYNEMASRHRARDRSIQIIKTAVLPAKKCVRSATHIFHNAHIKFPLTHVRPRRNHGCEATFVAHRPHTFKH